MSKLQMKTFVWKTSYIYISKLPILSKKGIPLALKGKCPRIDIFLVATSSCENWCCHISSQYEKENSIYHGKVVLTITEGTTI